MEELLPDPTIKRIEALKEGIVWCLFEGIKNAEANDMAGLADLIRAASEDMDTIQSLMEKQ